MIGLLIFPILICGYLYISSWPPERIKISLYHGWSLYIRAATYGFITVSSIFLIFGIFLPKIGIWIYEATGFSISSKSSIFDFISSLIERSNVFRITKTPTSDTSIDIASFSMVSILLTWITFKTINIITKSNNFTLKAISKFFSLEKIKTNSIKKVFLERSPVEYQLLTIADKAREDLSYNEQIKPIREKAFSAIISRKIDRENKEIMEELFSSLQYRTITYALITLENNKFYIGLPTIIPEPDEEGISSTSIQISPVVSGYRNEEKRLIFTTKYDFDLSNITSYDCIAFPRDKLLTVSGFSFSTYNRLNSELENRKDIEKKQIDLRF